MPIVRVENWPCSDPKRSEHLYGGEEMKLAVWKSRFSALAASLLPKSLPLEIRSRMPIVFGGGQTNSHEPKILVITIDGLFSEQKMQSASYLQTTFRDELTRNGGLPKEWIVEVIVT